MYLRSLAEGFSLTKRNPSYALANFILGFSQSFPPQVYKSTTVEPLNNGHIRGRIFGLCREVPISGVTG